MKDHTTRTHLTPRAILAGASKAPRSEALRTGALLDITAAAVATCMGMPSAVSPTLWRAVADDAHCRAGDPRVICLCWCVFLFVTGKAYGREERGPARAAVSPSNKLPVLKSARFCAKQKPNTN
jgi:hypothetical protein